MSLSLALLLAASVRAEPMPDLSAPPAPMPASSPEASSREPMRMKTPKGELRWSPGETFVSVLDDQGRRQRKIALAHPGRKPAGGLRPLMPARGEYFLVVEEDRRDVGLHLAERKAERAAKQTVVGSTLRLVHESGRVLWERPTEENIVVGRRVDPQHLQIAPDGTVALLLQDVDPYTQDRPLLQVIDPRGREALRLDYTAWARVDEFALSADGRSLAVHGFGLVPEDGEMSRAIGYYTLGKSARWIKGLPRGSSPKLRLQAVDAQGWTCCVDAEDGWLAFDADGSSKRLDPSEMRRRFGVAP